DGKNSGGNRWTARQILSTLGNATYLGLIKDGDALRPGVHEGIVSESLFARVRQIIESRRTRKPGRTEREGRWPLKGLIRCARCGRIMSSHTTRHGNKIYRYYRCRSQAAGRPPCPATQIAAHEIETFVMHALNTLGEDHRPEQRSDLAGFSEAWGLLSEKARRGIIPKIVSEVGYDPDAGRIFLTMNLEALREYAQSEPSVSRST
ncbi:MAG: recombinase zinc beta ribbon domain-containing protein, partial [Candidatus Hydrogenedentes bacterium]|nr:recombinase zinc beta ribbon domain-containing protein [Candidatus Hydrogenedentota bacterium]